MDTCRNEWIHAGMMVRLLLSKSTLGCEGNCMQRTDQQSTGQDRDGIKGQGRSFNPGLIGTIDFLFAGPFALHPKPAIIPALAHSGCGSFHIPYPGSSTSLGAELFCASGSWRLFQPGRSNDGHPRELPKSRFLNRQAPPESECTGAGPSDLFLTSSCSDSGAQ